MLPPGPVETQLLAELAPGGEQDDVFPPSLARKAAGRIPSATVELLPFGHGAHLADPSVTLPILSRFLSA